MNKTKNIIAAALIIVVSSCAYFLIAGAFKSDMTRDIKKAEAAKGTIAHLEQNLDFLVANKADAKMVLLQSEIADLKNRLAESEQARKKIETTLQDKINDMTNAENGLQEEIENGKKREAELEAQRTPLEEQVSKLTVQLNETQTQLASSKEIPLNESASEAKRIKRELLLQKKQLARIADLYNRLKDELKGFADIIDKKDDALYAKDKEIGNLKAQMDELEKCQTTVSSDDESQKAQANSLKKQVEVILQSPK
jgi:chromosome segregation ATPase